MDIKYRNSDSARILIKYIWSEVNNHYEKTNEHKIDFNNVNVEHLIPQSPGINWGLTTDEIKNYVNLLGNFNTWLIK